MAAKQFLTKDPAWQKLKNFYDSNAKTLNMLEMFNKDPQRFDKFRWVFIYKDKITGI